MRPALRVEGPTSGPVALFFHPFPLHAGAWEEMLAACAAAGWRAAAFDAPGFGAAPPLGRPLTMDLLAEMGAAALDSLGAASVVPKMLAPGTPEAIRRRVDELASRATPQGIADALRGMALRPDSTSDLPRWKAPTLAIAGAQDQLIPRAEMEKIARSVPAARLEFIEGTGHLPFLEKPREVAPILTAHLRAARARAPHPRPL